MMSIIDVVKNLKIESKVIDYGMSKTLKHVDPTLPHAKPKTLEQHQQNLGHLKKLSANNSKQIAHHDFEHNWANKFKNRILPRWHAAGYIANKEKDIKAAEHEVKFHKAKLDHYTKLQDTTKQKIAQHKSTIDTMTKSPTQTKTTKSKRLHLPSEPMHANATSFANIETVKDHNYYKRLSTVLKLKIDKNVRKEIKTLASVNSAEDYEHEYKNRIMQHTDYPKMVKAAKLAAKKLKMQASNSSKIEPYHNLMSNIYEECEAKLSKKGVDHTTPEYDKQFEAAMLSHPEIKKLEFLRRK